MTQVFLSLGSNKGDRFLQLTKAVEEIRKHIGKLLKISDVFESKSWAYEDADYLNIAVEIETILSPDKLLQKTQAIEKKLGRNTKTYIKSGKPVYAARTIDIDILFYGNEIINSDKLTIPHPLMHLRRFVLLPTMQIAADFIHPVFDETIKTLYATCEDKNSPVVFKKLQVKDFPE